MNPNVLTTAITAGAAVLTAIVALVLNHRGFASIESRITDLSSRTTALDNRLSEDLRGLDNRLSQDIREVRANLKQFFQAHADLDKRLGRIEDKLGIPPR
jgi:hypothetical protein